MTASHEKLLIGVFFFIMGTMVLLAAFGIGPMSKSAMHAPRWVVGFAGIVFLGCGIMLFETSQKLATFVAGLVTIGMTAICAWIALFGEDEYFSGGPSIFSDHIEVLIARVLFGFVAILGTVITINAFRKIFGGSDA